MNILYIVHDNKKGGAALSFLEMISHIKKEHNVYVLTPHKNGYLPQKLTELNIPHRNAHYFWWKIALPHNRIMASLRLLIYRALNVWNGVEARRIRKIVIDQEIDVIHSNSSVIDFGALLSKNTGIPHVWHLREYGEEDFNLKRVVSVKKYKNEMNAYAAGYVAISKSIKKKFANVVDENKIYQIYNGVSEKFSFQKDFINEDADRTKFLIAGNYCEEKGQTSVLKAVIELQQQGINDFELYLAGSGDFAEPKRLVLENGLEKVVTFCGLVDDMQQLRRMVDVEIVASKCEAFGRVTIEAMRMSNPVIGTNTGGTPELIMDGVNGFLFEYGNHIQLAECMKRYILDYTLIANMGKNAYQTANGNFTPEENADKIMEVYNAICG